MTYRDDASHNLDLLAYKSIRNLQLYINTVCGISNDDVDKLMEGFNSIIKCNDWEQYLVYEEFIGKPILMIKDI